jgi:hypothetical protein
MFITIIIITAFRAETKWESLSENSEKAEESNLKMLDTGKCGEQRTSNVCNTGKLL